jgi:AcrR family transcriptional regulator
LSVNKLFSGGMRTRDAERSREAILAAAEQLFAGRGYEAASLSEIGAAAGLSRGAPAYFFGSKRDLYTAVLARAFAARHAATAAAFEPVVAWCERPDGVERLLRALARAADGYMAFLGERAGFVRLVLREELAAARGLRALPQTSTAMHDAFSAVRRSGGGVRRFDVDEEIGRAHV